MTLDPQLVMLTTIALGTELTRQGMLTAIAYFRSKGKDGGPDPYDSELDGAIATPKAMDGDDVSIKDDVKCKE